MNDPRQRAPFAHQSSSLDLRGYAGTPPQPSGHYANDLKPPAPPGVSGGPGFFPPPPPEQLSSYQRAANAAAGALNGLTDLRMLRKGSDEGIDLDDYRSSIGTVNSVQAVFRRIRRSASGLLRRANPETSDGMSLPSMQTVRFVLLCTLWYASSAVSSNTGKVILNNFKFPVTLTIVQFAFVAGLCWLGSRPQLGWTSRLRTPTRSIIRHTLPMAAFQVGGHIFGSLAISRVPVSTVHTIKALSPLFTVAVYVLLFGVSYSPSTYVSLLPLTLGVMLACSFDISLSNFLGLVCAFGSTIVFVSQNIFFKKVMHTSGAGTTDTPKLDKINLLYFSSALAFLLMVPVWIYSDLFPLISLWFGNVPFPGATGTASGAKIAVYLTINGTIHFAQCAIAFAILASTSPVTYSIASLIKRIAVICLAIVWFNQPVHPVQAIGISLTGLGLYMYNNAKRDVDKGEKRMRQVEAQREGMLPTTVADQRILEGCATPEYFAQDQYTFNPSQLAPHLKEAHASPRPHYNAHFEPPTVAKASARPPTMPVARKPSHHDQPPQPYPYPSPPASTASSPPLPPNGRDDVPVTPVALTAGA